MWVLSSLSWGIHVPAARAATTTIDDLCNAKFAISRFGSGSELMARVLASQRGWAWASAAQDEAPFLEVGSIDGALAALRDGDADAFLWCQTMTQQHKEVMVQIGRIETPWPSFVLVLFTFFFFLCFFVFLT